MRSKNEIRDVGKEARCRSVLKSKGRRCIRKKVGEKDEGRKEERKTEKKIQHGQVLQRQEGD